MRCALLTLSVVVVPAVVGAQLSPQSTCTAPWYAPRITQLLLGGKDEFNDKAELSEAQQDSAVRSLAGRYQFIDVASEGGDRSVRWGSAQISLRKVDGGHRGTLSVRNVRRLSGVAALAVATDSLHFELYAWRSQGIKLLEAEDPLISDSGTIYDVYLVFPDGRMTGRWHKPIHELRVSLEAARLDLTEMPSGYFCLFPIPRRGRVP